MQNGTRVKITGGYDKGLVGIVEDLDETTGIALVTVPGIAKPVIVSIGLIMPVGLCAVASTEPPESDEPIEPPESDDLDEMDKEFAEKAE